ncbi:MAG TPA: aminoglycoside phosphotransferase family protein [Gemmatimonadaceae bacterium]|nr:aminoglycoside phosphotransferase family protein [Gemmatimonadaceae bacterium]
MAERDLEEIRSAALAVLKARAAEFGLGASRLEVGYVLNWGGFVNQSFHVTDGATKYHLKLARESGQLKDLAQWRGLHALLNEQYLAPMMVDWIDVPRTRHAGPLFEFVDGAVPDVRSASLHAAIEPMLARLHHDAELVSRLAGGGVERQCLDTFLDTYLDRFVKDMDYVAKAPPPFVERTTLDWMRAEIAQLEHRARTTDSFADPARSAIHGDLWLNNILMTDTGRCVVLDWDDLAVGDPAIDWAMFLGPSTRALRPLQMDDLPQSAPRDASFRQRFAFYARASLFDWILDPLADWIDATAAPEYAPLVRAEKERVHQASLGAYLKAYG